MKEQIFFLILLLCIANSNIPTIQPLNKTLFESSNYSLNYYSTKNFTLSSLIQIDFSSSDITISNTNQTSQCLVTINDVVATSASCSCNKTTCSIQPKMATSMNSNIIIIFGPLVNPPYFFQQKVNVIISFYPSNNETSSVIIPSNIYQAMPITVNSFKQSDYGVGTNNVSYTFNLSFPYYPNNPQIQIAIPSEVGYSTLTQNFSFYGSVQNTQMIQASNIIIVSTIASMNNSPNGFMLLKITGFINPQFIGNSSNFAIIMLQQYTSNNTSCANCKVAELFSSLQATSTTSGDIQVSIFNSSNLFINSMTNLTIGLNLVAPIPVGGLLAVIFDSGITVPSIYCDDIYGFTLTNGTSPICSYNSSTNSIMTSNFAVPYLYSQGNVIILVQVKNSPDNRPINIYFETEDASGRIIGKSRQSYIYSSAPLPLNVSVSKNNSQIQSTFKLQVNITLSQNLNISTDKIVVVLPPSGFYNLSMIVCSSSSINLNCSSQIDSLSNLIITLNPPCVNCTANSQISFTIDNLVNPSFINNQTQIIYVQTKNNFGVIQSSETNIALSAMKLNVTNYDWKGNNTVGQYFTLNLSAIIPQYIKQNGGVLRFQCQQNSTYTDVLSDYQNIGNYNFVYSLSVTDYANVSLSNTVQYFYNSLPYSIQAINIQICTPNTSCTGNINIFGLRRSFYTLSTLYQTIKATTLNGDLISSILMQVNSQNSIKVVQNLYLSLSQSTTNMNSNYVFTFNMNKLPFDSGLIISLSSMHKINTSSGCFIVANTTFLGFTFNCTILNQQNIQISYSGDPTMMTFQIISYSVTIKSVLNPSSIIPLTYSISTMIRSTVNCLSTTSYSIQNAYSLSQNYSKSNNTYGQVTNLSISISPTFYPFDSLILYINKNTLLFQSVLQNSYKLNQNSTFYIIQDIYNLNNNQIVLSGSNPTSTALNGSIYIQMYVGGYLSSKGNLLIGKVDPIYLPVITSSSNRYVGKNTTLTVKVNRQITYPQQWNIVIVFPTSLLTLSNNNGSFSYNGIDMTTFSFMTNISSQNQTIIIQNLTNMGFIPNNQTVMSLQNIKIYTIDKENNIVAYSQLQDSDIVPNRISQAQTYIFQRSSNQSNQIIHLNITYISNVPQNASIMQIYLPKSQNKFIGQSYCIYTGIAPMDINCSVYSQTQNSITIAYMNGANVILKNLINLYPSEQNMTVTLLTKNNQLIQNSSKIVSPSIQLDPLLISGWSNSTFVANSAQLNFNITNSNSEILINSTLRIQFPKLFYTKVKQINSKDCNYQILGINYTGCEYTNYDSSIWLRFVKINNLGPIIIPINSTIQIKLYLTNSWSSYRFSHNSTSFGIISGNNQSTAFGILALGSIYSNISSFQGNNFNNVKILQSNSNCSANNTLQFILNVSTIIPVNTTIYLMIPKSIYVSNNLTYLVTSVLDYNYYNYIIPLTCSLNNSILCQSYNSVKNFSLFVSNFKYVPQLASSISLYLVYDGLPTTQISSQIMPAHIASPIPNAQISRLNTNVNQFTQINTLISATLQQSNDFYIQIKPSGANYNSLLQTCSHVNYSSYSYFTSSNPNTTLPFTQQNNQLTIYVSSLLMYQVNLSIFGINPRFALISNELYDIKLYDSDYVYYSTTKLLINGSLTPYSTGLKIKRQNNFVGASSSYTLIGISPDLIQNTKMSFNGSTPINLTESQININLGLFTNPSSIYQNNINNVTIYNGTYIVYKNLHVPTVDSLQTYDLTSVRSIAYKKTMIINSTQNLTIFFNNQSSVSSNIIILVPTFFKMLISCSLNNISQNNYVLEQISVNNSLMHKIRIGITPNLTINNVSLTFITNDYQLLINNSHIFVQSQLPTKSYSSSFSLNLMGQNIISNLSSSSLKVNQKANYTINITALTRNGTIRVSFPSFLTNQIQTYQQSLTSNSQIIMNAYNANQTLSLSKDNITNNYFTQLPVAPFTPQFSFYFINFNNPSTNEPFTFEITQSQPTLQNQIYGYNSLTLQMQQLDDIYIYSAERNQSKVGQPVKLTINLTNPSNGDEHLVLLFPSHQITINQNINCSVKSVLDQIVQNLTCTRHPTISNAIITQKISGNMIYIIQGYQNVNFSKVPGPNDKVKAFIGQPYNSAISQLNNSVFIIPLVTAGNLTLQSFSSSTNKIFSKTNLKFALGLKNYLQVDSIWIVLDQYNYLIDSELKCKINNIVEDCWKSQNNSIMINSQSLTTTEVNINIHSGVTNNLKQSNFTIKTLKLIDNSTLNNTNSSSSLVSSRKTETKNVKQTLIRTSSLNSFGVIDMYYSTINDSPMLQPNNELTARIIVTQNYVSAKPALISIIFDYIDVLPTKFIQLSNLKVNLTSNIQNCNFYNIEFSQTINQECLFSASLNAKINYVLYYNNNSSDIVITESQKALLIYPALSNSCTNQQCDQCSSINGIQYCFSCREGLLQFNGQCVQSCPSSYVNEISSSSCQPCSPECSSCFALYSTNCLSCRQANLTLSSGSCIQSCSYGQFQYNGYCVMNQECYGQNGCRICSNNGFCYECLPSYHRQLTKCIYSPQLPPTIMTYFQIVILIASITFIIIGTIRTKQQKTKSLIMLYIFFISISQICAWIFTIPQSPNIASGVFLVFICISRILVSITIYTRFYRYNLGQLSKHIISQDQKQDQNEKQKNQIVQQNNQQNKISINNWKTKLVRFFCCINGPDSLCLLQSRISEPIIKCPSNFVYQTIYQLCRIVSIIFMGYLISLNVQGDLTILPLLSIICGISIILIRFGMSQTAQKIGNCIRRSK